MTMLFVAACSDSPFSAENEKAAVPVITGQPQSAAYSAGAAAQALTVTASVSDGGTLSYQWYSNAANSNENGTIISGKTESSYTPPTAAPGIVYYYVIVTNTLNKKTAAKASNTARIEVNNAPATYTVVIDIIDSDSGDTVTASPDTGIAGATVTLSYTVADTAHYNQLDFSGVTAAIASVEEAGTGTRTYAINAADSANGVITITATFTHTDLAPDHIAFTEGHINKTYGDAVFTNAITAEHGGAITYSSSDETVAAVDSSSGQVTIHKAGSALITAEKAADDVYARASASYTLTVNPKPVTITGLSVANKQYDGTTTATVTGVAVISGLVGGDDVSVGTGTAAFADKNVGTGITVTFSGYSLTGADAGNYILIAQPESVTANIELVSMIEMASIPAGTFSMGQTGVATPVHSVTLSGFYMSKYQVTQAQYQAVMGAGEDRTTTTYGKGDNYPIYYVNWYDAIVFCNKLSVMEGLTPAYRISGSTDPAVWIAGNGGSIPTSSNAIWNAVEIVSGSNGYRLPTEAQWEYACRAGTTTAYNTGDTITTDQAWYTSNSGSKTHEVGLKPANAWGLYDMHGNVFEWCWDWYGSYSSDAQTDPMGASSGSDRVFRGGSWSDSAGYLRSAYRHGNSPYYRGYSIGFRLARP